MFASANKSRYNSVVEYLSHEQKVASSILAVDILYFIKLVLIKFIFCVININNYIFL